MTNGEEEVSCTCSDKEIAESFIKDVESVKDLLPNEQGKLVDKLKQLRFFNQRAGRELWIDKPREIQDEDIENADITLGMAISALSEQESLKERIEKLYLEESLKEDLENLMNENERLRNALSENKGEWIPIKDQLPKDGEEVLVSLTPNGVHGKKVEIDCFMMPDIKYWQSGKVEAWQPKPEPYKGKE